jgi:hypothetical protein
MSQGATRCRNRHHTAIDYGPSTAFEAHHVSMALNITSRTQQILTLPASVFASPHRSRLHVPAVRLGVLALFKTRFIFQIGDPRRSRAGVRRSFVAAAAWYCNGMTITIDSRPRRHPGVDCERRLRLALTRPRGG